VLVIMDKKFDNSLHVLGQGQGAGHHVQGSLTIVCKFQARGRVLVIMDKGV
jgi:hypothetical protein